MTLVMAADIKNCREAEVKLSILHQTLPAECPNGGEFYILREDLDRTAVRGKKGR